MQDPILIGKRRKITFLKDGILSKRVESNTGCKIPRPGPRPREKITQRKVDGFPFRNRSVGEPSCTQEADELPFFRCATCRREVSDVVKGTQRDDAAAIGLKHFLQLVLRAKCPVLEFEGDDACRQGFTRPSTQFERVSPRITTKEHLLDNVVVQNAIDASLTHTNQGGLRNRAVLIAYHLVDRTGNVAKHQANRSGTVNVAA